MKFFDFNLLGEMDKMNVLEKAGVLVAVRTEGLYRFELFQIGDFYVEQQVHINRNIRKPYRSFNRLRYLDPYLDAIDLSSLVGQI